MACNFKSAVDTAVEMLSTYVNAHGPADFPTIKGKLMPIVEAKATVDNIYVKRFKETMRPILGQLRRVEESNGPYQPVEQHGVIYLCPSLELEWHRFIVIKEACHLILDAPDDYIHTEIDLDSLMVCLAQFGEEGVNKHYMSEQCAMLCAQELLLPRPTRQKLASKYAEGAVSAAEIARAARVPAEIIRSAMSDEYEAWVRPFYED